MKKVLIFLSLLIVILLVLPIIGNKFIEDTLNTKIKELKANGVGVSNEIVDSSYLDTSRHYEFYIEDIEQFMRYINSYSDEQLSPYIELFLEGALVGADLEYSNFPFMKALLVDIYPLSLSSKMKEDLEKEDSEFNKYVDKFLKDKGILYHLSYDVVSQDFNGYIKDIDEEYELKDATKILFKLQNALYSGNGELIAPKLLNSKIEIISLNVSKQSEVITLKSENFTYNSKFESRNTYVSDVGIENIELNITVLDGENIMLSADDIKTYISANTEKKYAQLFTKSSLKNLHLNSKEIDIKSKSFKYDIAFNDMDKDSLEELRVVLSKLKYQNSATLEEEMKYSLISFLSKGIKVNISELSLNDIVLNSTQKLESVSLQALLTLEQDKNLVLKVNYAPLLLLSTIDANVKLKLSKEIFALISQSFPMAYMVKAYAKEDANNLIYEIIYQNGELKINGKGLYN